MGRRVFHPARGDAKMYHLVEQDVAELVFGLVVEVADGKRERVGGVAPAEKLPAQDESALIRQGTELRL